MTNTRHTPVLLQESLEWLRPLSGQFVIDGTIGSGGHAERIIAGIDPDGTLLGVDWDPNAVERAERRLAYQAHSFRVSLKLVLGNYADIARIMERERLPKANGLLIDLGFSSDQLEDGGKGLSFLRDEPLDMRYGVDERNNRSAADIVRASSEEELTRMFREFGEERFAGRIARAIVAQRKQAPIATSRELAETVSRAIPGMFRFRGSIHPATRVFQALRIVANHELENLSRLLSSIPEILSPDGRAVFLSFHSLDDRLVKHVFREYERSGMGSVLTKKPVTPSAEEVIANPRSRSAKLRAFHYHPIHS